MKISATNLSNIIFRIVLFIVLIMLILLGMNVRKYVTYSTTDGVVTEVVTSNGSANDSTRDSSSYGHYLKINYIVGGKTYSYQQQVFLSLGHEVGDCITVKYDCLNPEKIYNSFLTKIYVLIILFTTCFDILLYRLTRKNGKTNATSI